VNDVTHTGQTTRQETVEQRANLKKSPFYWAFLYFRAGDPGMTRTCDLRFRKPSLYPAELRDRSFRNWLAGISASIYQSRSDLASLV
jgi:hypothetical protein